MQNIKTASAAGPSCSRINAKTAIADKAVRLKDKRFGRASRIADAALRWAGLALAMLLLTRAAPLSAGAPFAVAFFTAALFVGRAPAALLIGCALGCPWEGNAAYALSPLLGCGIALLLRTLPRRVPFLRKMDLESGRVRDVYCAAAAGISMLISALPFVADMPYDLVIAAVNAMLAMASAPTLITALNMSFKRKRLLGEEQISLVLLGVALMIGIRMLPAVGQHLAHLVASLMTLGAACCSVGTGAVCGVLTGSVLTMLGDTPYVGVALALCGLLAGVVKPLGRPAMALSFSLGNAISLIFTSGEQFGVINPYVALLAGVLLCFVPAAAEKRLSSWFAPQPPGSDSELLAERIRYDAERRMRALGLLFEEMSVGYEIPSPLPDEQALVMRMRARLCEGCAGYERCWSGADSRAGRLLVELLSDALCGRLIDADAKELPPDLCRKCRRANQIPRKLGPMLSEFDQQRRAAKERGECKVLLSSQFRQASEALNAEGDKLARPMRFDRELANRAHAALDREGLSADGVWAVEDDPPRLFVGLGGRTWNRSAIAKATRGLSQTLGIEMKVAAACEGALDGELCFIPAPRMSVDVGFAGRAGETGGTSGDSRLTGALSDGRVLLALSDGMGSGARAQGESAQALKLLKRFLNAGVPCAMALDAINELLLLRSGDEMFSTADLCVLDLGACRADFLKLGGCASLILRKDRIIRVEGGRLPMGVLGRVSPLETSVRLQQDDLIVMVTDGVLDGSREGQIEWLESMVRRYKGEPPQKLCERLVSLAAARKSKRKDDMTALAAKIGAA